MMKCLQMQPGSAAPTVVEAAATEARYSYECSTASTRTTETNPIVAQVTTKVEDGSTQCSETDFTNKVVPALKHHQVSLLVLLQVAACCIIFIAYPIMFIFLLKCLLFIYTHTHISLRSILTLSFHLRLGLPKYLFPVRVSVKILKALLSSSILATCPAHLKVLDSILGE